MQLLYLQQVQQPELQQVQEQQLLVVEQCGKLQVEHKQLHFQLMEF
jgi:hypothetical protein